MGGTTQRRKAGAIPVFGVLGFLFLGSLVSGNFAIFYAILFVTLVYVAACLLARQGS